jgi:hypothetical protein
MEYPKDKLYLRVGNLLTKMKQIAYDNGNFELYAHLSQISKWVVPPILSDDIDIVISVENRILSPNFLNQKCFKEIDKENLRPIIREYKLNMLV